MSTTANVWLQCDVSATIYKPHKENFLTVSKGIVLLTCGCLAVLPFVQCYKTNKSDYRNHTTLTLL